MKKFLKYFFTFLMFLVETNCFTQPAVTDSLKTLLQDVDSNENRYIELLNEISYSFYRENADSILTYAGIAYDFSKQNNYLQEEAWALAHIGYAYKKKSEDEKSLLNLNKALAIFERLDLIKGISFVNNLLGIRAYLNSDYNQALLYFEKAVEGYKKIDDQLGLAKAYNNMGVISKKRGQFNKAIDYYHSALRIEEALGDYLGVSELYNNISSIYSNLFEYDEAYRYLNLSLEIKKKHNLTTGVAKTITNIGLIHLHKNEPEKAFKIISKSIELKEEMGDSIGLAISYYLFGSCYIKFNKFDSASYWLNKSINVSLKSKNRKNWAWANYHIGVLNLEQNNFQESIRYTEYAYGVGKEMGNIQIIMASAETISKCYNELGKHEKALSYFKEYKSLTDSITRKSAVIKLEAFKYEQEKLKIEHELNQKQLKLKAKQKQVRLIGIILGLIIVTGLIGVIQYYKVKRKNKLLFDKNLELTKVELSGTNQKPSAASGKKDESKVNESSKSELLKDLNLLITNEKCYTDSSITLESLADKLKTNRSYLSRLINEQYKCNFSRFINEFRVREARALLINPDYQNFTIEAIAKEVGFNSKSAFNIAFKEFTGITPSYYKSQAMSL